MLAMQYWQRADVRHLTVIRGCTYTGVRMLGRLVRFSLMVLVLAFGASAQHDDASKPVHVTDDTCHWVSTVKMFSYQAYESYLHRDNDPRVSIAQGGGLRVFLQRAMSIRITDGSTGTVLASYPPPNEVDVKEYKIPPELLAASVGHLIVVDVIRRSDKSYRGTESIPYMP